MRIYKNTRLVRLITVFILMAGICFCGPAALSMESKDMSSRASGRYAAPDATDEEIQELTRGNAEFAFDLYHQVKSDGENLFYSPYSISLALGMTYAGARGHTAGEMADAMHFTLADDRLHNAFNKLAMIMEERGKPNEEWETKGFKLNIANALWGNTDTEFRQPFLDLIQARYGAGLRQVDFKRAAEQARLTINNWVEEQTEERIKDLLPPSSVNELTRLILVNAIYFNAAWANPFNERRTNDEDFFLLEGGSIQVPMMHQTEDMRYCIGDGYKAITLPYEGRDLAMTIIVPDQGRFEEFENGLSADTIDALHNEMSYHEIILTMPKFTFESGFSLKDTLSKLGMPGAFKATADFSGMSETEALMISDVFHKAFVKVDEEGTEAAAATAVVMALTSAPMEEPEPIEIRVDKPFIFLIWDFQTRNILFVGRVLNPS